MSVIYLVRHGQASLRSSNYDDLSPKGIYQCELLGKSFRNRIKDVSIVQTGSLIRHQQSYEQVRKKFRMQASRNINAAWDEYNFKDIIEQYNSLYKRRLILGAVLMRNGKPKENFLKIFNKAIERWMSGQHNEDYVETWHHYQNRCNRALNLLIESLDEEDTALVFTSGGVISAVTQRLLNLPDEYFMRFNTKIVNSSVTKIISTSNNTFVSTFNDYSHLEKNREDITYI